MSVRATNCHLTGDQLAISGAVADGADNTTRDGQCPVPPQQARNLADELAATNLRPATRPAWSSCRTAPTTSTSAPASSTSWPVSSGSASGSATAASPTVRSRRRSPATWPTSAGAWPAPSRRCRRTRPTIAVLDYYQPIPEPSQIAKGTATSGLHTNLVCSGLKPNAASTYAAAQVVLAALEQGCRRRRGGRPAASRQERHPGGRVEGLRRPRHLHGRPLGLLGRARVRRDPGRRRGAHSGGQGLFRDDRAARGHVLCGTDRVRAGG